MPNPREILRVLDRGAEAFVFPILDNGYVYLAATRLSLHWSTDDLGARFRSVRLLATRRTSRSVCARSVSRQRDRDPPERYVSREAYLNYLAQHPNDDSILMLFERKARIEQSLIFPSSTYRPHDIGGRAKRKGLVQFGLRTTCRGGGMADAADLKSSVRPST